jgi:hypothetical protein
MLQNQSGAQEAGMHISTSTAYYDNRGTASTNASSPPSSSRATFDDLLEESSQATSKSAIDNDQSTDDGSWLPDRLSGTLYIVSPDSLATKDELIRASKGERIPAKSMTWVPVSPCPQWYSDLAQISADSEDPDTQKLLKEYYGCLKEAMGQVLDNNNIPADDWLKHYNDLIVDKAKSEKIHQEVRESLYSHPRTVEVMNDLGIGSDSLTQKG